MLTLHDPLHRRQFLRVGGLSLGGLTLADAFALKSFAKTQKLPLRDKSVIFLFQHGGPSQFETFDPKMDAPREIRDARDHESKLLEIVPVARTVMVHTVLRDREFEIAGRARLASDECPRKERAAAMLKPAPYAVAANAAAIPVPSDAGVPVSVNSESVPNLLAKPKSVTFT